MKFDIAADYRLKCNSESYYFVYEVENDKETLVCSLWKIGEQDLETFQNIWFETTDYNTIFRFAKRKDSDLWFFTRVYNQVV